MITLPGKIPISIHPFFWLLAGLIGWMNSGGDFALIAVWIGVVFFSVLVHELGHALTSIAFGQSASIELMALGGLTKRSGPKLKLWKEFFITLNGPVAGFMLFFCATLFYSYLGKPALSNYWLYALVITIYANLVWTILNLLPIYPLDGGRLLSIILESLFGLKGMQASFLFSGIVGVLIAIFFFYTGALLAGSIMLLLAYESYRSWKSSLHLSKQDEDSSLQELLKQADQAQKSGDLSQAKELLNRVVIEGESGVLSLAAAEQLAILLDKEGNAQAVYDLLLPLEKRLSMNARRILHQSAYAIGQLNTVVAIGDRSYHDFPNYHTALINSLSYALLNQAKPAVGWLQRAVDDGLPNLKEIISRKEYETVRNNHVFQAISNRYKT